MTTTPFRPTTVDLASFPDSSVVQLVSGDPQQAGALVAPLHGATVNVSSTKIVAVDGDFDWSWMIGDLTAVIHGADEPWTMLVVPGIADFGVSVPIGRVEEFRSLLDSLSGPPADRPAVAPRARDVAPPRRTVRTVTSKSETSDRSTTSSRARRPGLRAGDRRAHRGSSRRSTWSNRYRCSSIPTGPTTELRPGAVDLSAGELTGIEARNISAWFGNHNVLDRVSLDMPAGHVTSLIGPSGCGKSTFLRILNRMHEMIPAAAMAGEVFLDGHDIYDPSRKLTDARREIGMVFQKPNPFPAMSIYDNVVASLRLTGTKATQSEKDALVESCLSKAGLWNEVRIAFASPAAACRVDSSSVSASRVRWRSSRGCC